MNKHLPIAALLITFVSILLAEEQTKSKPESVKPGINATFHHPSLDP
tara:strand:- start:424 stop:564 length:141 start_codon:yes stop_codon:yes gene_type:complete